ncbi:MAG: 5'-nucleotidase C-terminal domain-containing protein [Pseudomonadota bacterium]
MTFPRLAVIETMLAFLAWGGMAYGADHGEPKTSGARRTGGRQPAMPEEDVSPGGTDHGGTRRQGVTLSVVATMDLHGRVETLPILGGFVANLRRARSADGGGVVLVDAGDMLQGTLESNLGEGESVIQVYRLLGYTAVSLGNHEFDFGPVGIQAIPRTPADDPHGVIKARAKESSFPWLCANLREKATRKTVAWENVVPSVVVTVAGVKVGIVGGITGGASNAVIAANFVGLETGPLAPAVAYEAARLRSRGARVVLAVVHAGGSCRSFADPADLRSCDSDSELFELARDLPSGAVNLIVGGHSHGAVAHYVGGVPVVQAYAEGKAFARVDLVVGTTGEDVAASIHRPQPLCRKSPRRRGQDGRRDNRCDPGQYEGADVVPDPAVARVLSPALERARVLGSQSLGVLVAKRMRRSSHRESALANLLADLMLAVRDDADLAVTNTGAIRHDLPAGVLTYQLLYEAYPFDNRFAMVRLSGADLRRLLARSLTGRGDVLAVAGARVSATCEKDGLTIRIQHRDGHQILDSESLVLATNDFLAMGPLFRSLGLVDGAIVYDTGQPIRDLAAEVLKRRGGRIGGDGDPPFLEPAAPRIEHPGSLPVRCRGGGRQ